MSAAGSRPDATSRSLVGPLRDTRVLIVVGLVVLAAALAIALRPQPETQADRVARLASELRCPVCQGLSVEDSPSDTAKQMRELIAQRVAQGRTDDQIRTEFRDAYGDWIFLSPPLLSARGAIWLVPIAVVVIGLAVIGVRMRRGPPAEAAPPSPEQLALLRERMSQKGSPQ